MVSQDLQDLQDLLDESSTSPPTTAAKVLQDKLDSLAPEEPKETKETLVLQDWPPKDRRESPASSWGLMGNLSISVGWAEHRVIPALQDLLDRRVRLVLQDRRGRSACQDDMVGQV